MMQISPQMRILVAVKPVDFRKGIDGLAGICRSIQQFPPTTALALSFKGLGKK